jgi:hypothetical protein
MDDPLYEAERQRLLQQLGQQRGGVGATEILARLFGGYPKNTQEASGGYVGEEPEFTADPALQSTPQPVTRPSPNTARATSEWANRKRDPLEVALANAQAAASGAATKRMSLEQGGADAVIDMLKGRGKQDLRGEYAALVKANQPEAGDLLRARQGDTLAPIMEALLRGVSDPITGQPVVGKHIADATTNADTRAEKRRAERIAQGVTGMGFGKDDTSAANALMEQMLLAQRGRAMSEMLPVDAAVAGQKMAHDDALKRGEWDKSVQVARIAHPQGKDDPLRVFNAVTERIGAISDAIAKQPGGATPQQQLQLQGLQGMLKQPRDIKYDKDRAAVAKDALTSLAAGKVPKGQEDAVISQFVIDVAEGTHTIEEAKEGLRRKLLALQGGGK